MKKNDLKITPKRAKALIEKIENGVPVMYAVRAAGIHESTYYNYKQLYQKFMNKEEVPQGKKHKFLIEMFEKIKEAEAKFIEKNVLLIQVASVDNWQAAAWQLERRAPDHFGKKERHEVSGALIVDPRLEKNKKALDQANEMDKFLDNEEIDA